MTTTQERTIDGHSVRQIPGFDHYWITCHGYIWSSWKKQWRPIELHNGSYWRATLSKNNFSTHFMVNQLVAQIWIGPQPEGKPFVLHKDHNPSNNHYLNLEWGSHQDNMEAMKAADRQCSGEARIRITESALLRARALRLEKFGAKDLTDAQVLEIHRRVRSGESPIALSREFYVSKEQVRVIGKEEVRKHLWTANSETRIDPLTVTGDDDIMTQSTTQLIH